jgi:hypothetical protein
MTLTGPAVGHAELSPTGDKLSPSEETPKGDK